MICSHLIYFNRHLIKRTQRLTFYLDFWISFNAKYFLSSYCRLFRRVYQLDYEVVPRSCLRNKPYPKHFYVTRSRFLPMSGFEPRASGVGNKHWATITHEIIVRNIANDWQDSYHSTINNAVCLEFLSLEPMPYFL